MSDPNKWPVDAIERRNVADLIPYARNARTHSDAQIEQLAASIREWGWTNPVLIDAEGGLISGHGRVLAARKLGIKDVPCMIATGWSETQKRAYILADNQLALLAGWDVELLKIELEDIAGENYNLALTGFDSLFMDTLLEDGFVVADPIAELAGTGNEPLAARTIHVHFKDEADAADFARRLNCAITEKTKSLWFPPA